MYQRNQANIASSIRASKQVEQGCSAYFSHISDVDDIEAPSIESILVVSEFREVFPNNLP